jgi:hypothetical protein
VQNIFIFETTNHLCNRIGFANMPEKLVTETLAFRGTGNQPGDIDKLHCRRNYFFWLDDFGKLLQSRIRNLDYSDIWIDRAKGIVFRGDSGPG